MSVIHITGLRHHWVQEPDTDKASALVEEKLRQLPLGTLLLLQLEPNNPVTPAMGEDKGAVAVYDEQYNRIGYVNKTFRLQLHKHMNEYTLLEARYAGSDGHVTMYANVDDLEDMSVTLDGLTRKLPAAPIPPLEYTPEEERLRVMTHSLLKPDLATLDGAGRYLSLVRSYLPLSAISLCSEDSLLRCQVINNLSELMKRKEPFDAGQQQEACELRKQLNATEGDFHRRPDKSLEQLLRRHLDTLRRQASAADERAFFHRFDALYKEGLRAKLDELEVWLKQLPWTTAYDRHNLGRLADGLVIMNLTRRDLYDVCAVLLLLERDELQQLRPADVGQPGRLLPVPWAAEGRHSQPEQRLLRQQGPGQQHQQGQARQFHQRRIQSHPAVARPFPSQGVKYTFFAYPKYGFAWIYGSSTFATNS